MNPTTASAILKLLDIVVLGLTLAPQIKESYEANRLKVQSMVDEGRDPTTEEWDELLSEVQELSNELNS